MSCSQRLISTIVALFLPILSQEVRAAETAGPQELILAVYSVPKEAYEKRIIPAIQQQWKQRTGQEVRIRSSYGASGAQARAIIGGFQADIAALSVEGDLDQVAKAGLITHNWRGGPHQGIVTASVGEDTYAPQLPRDTPAISPAAEERQTLLMECLGLAVPALIAGSQAEIEERPCDTPLVAQAPIDA